MNKHFFVCCKDHDSNGRSFTLIVETAYEYPEEREALFMTITIPPELETDLIAIAQTEGLSPEKYLQ